ncbi:potassium channel family protein [Desertivirga arenae]|uniref:potassium channel family protein n=1 Tax=Desertivirga arenae TaxID=2810309 RepID=UPI001A971581|nr:ion transporter [Pedobacter sp. SYSU D00823]
MENSNQLKFQRQRLLKSVECFLDGPMVFLGFVWLLLLIIEFIKGLTPSLQLISEIIWLVFIVDFLIKFVLAPEKLKFLKSNILTIFSLALPALRLVRFFRVMRLLRFARGSRLIKVVASLNRGMRSLNATMRRRGFAYVVIFTILVILSGAAGMLAFESQVGGIQSYSNALWWTTMLIITIGSDYWPQTSEGRALCILLSIYGFAIFGYITATISSFFVGRDAEEKDAPLANSHQVETLKKEIHELKTMIGELQATMKNKGE